MADFYNLSLEADRIDALLLFLNENETDILLQSNIKGATGSSTTDTMSQKAITDALGGKVDVVVGGTSGNLPKLTANGGLADSDIPATDVATKQELAVATLPGLAEAVIDTDNAGTEQEFTFRKSGGDGGAFYRKVLGRTIAINQLVDEDTTEVTIPSDHKYFAVINGTASVATSDGTALAVTGGQDMVVDLTLAGLASEISTPGDFNALYPNPIGYTPGVLKSNDYATVKTIGRNQYNPATGKAKVIGGTAYYIGGTYTSLSQDGVAITPAGDGTFTPASTGEVEVVGGNATDTIINISDADNGLWQPYWERTLPLGLTTKKDSNGNIPFPNGAQGAGTVGDWCDEQGGEVVMVEVDLGDLEWSYSSSYNGYFSATPPSPLGSSNLGVCSRYAYDSGFFGDAEDKVWIPYNFFGLICVRDSSFNGDAAAFKLAMAGVKAIYQKATPTPFTWAEPLKLAVKVDEGGTEEAVQPAGATEPSAPFTAMTTYTMSIARMVAKLNSIQ